MKLARRYSGTFFFFPAILPLVEIVPWVLTLMAAAAGVAGFSWQRHRRIILILGVGCLCIAAGVVLHNRPDKNTAAEGTRLIHPERFAVATHHRVAPPYRQNDMAQFGEIWSKSIAKQMLSSPVIAGDILVYGTYGKTVEAVARQDGGPVWTIPLNAPVFSMAIDADQSIYAGEGLHDTQASSLVKIDAAKGSILWQREFLGHLEEAPRFDDKEPRMWIAAGPGGLWGLNTKSARVLFHANIGHIDAQALHVGSALYVPAQIDEEKKETSFFALDAAHGKTLWQADLPGQPWGSPTLDQTGTVILTTTGLGQIGVKKDTDRGWAQAFSRDGRALWQVDLPGMVIQPSAMIAENNTIIHVMKTGDIMALKASDGATLWHANAGGDTQSSGTLMTGGAVPLLAVTTYDGIFTIRNALTGDEIVHRQVGKNVTSSPVVDGDVIYVGSAYTITAFGGIKSLMRGP